MAESLVLYTAIHEPLPLRLPALPAPAGVKPDDLERCIFDLRAAEIAFREVIGPAYGAALGTLSSADHGFRLSISVSDGLLEMGRRWGPELPRRVRQLLRSPSVEPVAADPHGGLLFAFDVERFMRTMEKSREDLARSAERSVRAAEVSGFCLNREIYHALGQLGFAVVAAEGDARVTDGRHPAHLGRWGEGPLVAYRLQWLSDELGYWLRSGKADVEKMADEIALLPGEAALIGFDFAALAFGPGGAEGGVQLLSALTQACQARGVRPLTVSEASERFSGRAVEHAPPSLTAMSGFSINGERSRTIEEVGRDGWTERLIFGRMQQAYQMSRMVNSRGVRRVADWLLQRVNLRLPRLAAAAGDRPPSYWRMRWWEANPSYDDTAGQVLAVYDNFIRAAAGYNREDVAT